MISYLNICMVTMIYKKHIKNVLDIILALGLIIITLPALLCSVLGLAITNRSLNVFFLQKRPGLHGKIFTLYKLKTLKDISASESTQLKDSERATIIGKILRKYSIDELPQLFNVIKGDMSLIGPRPLLPEYLSLYSPEHAKRHDVKPGLSGWAQINGRNNTTFDERLNYDVWYVKNISFLLDLKIFWTTLFFVFKPSNVLDDDPNNFFEQMNKNEKS